MRPVNINPDDGAQAIVEMRSAGARTLSAMKKSGRARSVPARAASSGLNGKYACSLFTSFARRSQIFFQS
jgi:hypothetical protein